MRAFVLHQLESVLNGYLRLDDETIARLATLSDKLILLNIKDWNVHLYIQPTHNGLTLHHSLDAKPTTTLTGKLESLVRLSVNSSSASLFKNKIDIQGDIATGEKIQEILAHIDIDWEEHLAKLTGDIFAHKLGSTVRRIKQVSTQSLGTIAQNLKDFLQLETEMLPTRTEIQEFSNKVSTLRNDVERLEAKYTLLLNKVNKKL